MRSCSRLDTIVQFGLSHYLPLLAMVSIPLIISEAFSMLVIAAQIAALDPLMVTCASTIMVFLLAHERPTEGCTYAGRTLSPLSFLIAKRLLAEESYPSPFL